MINDTRAATWTYTTIYHHRYLKIEDTACSSCVSMCKCIYVVVCAAYAGIPASFLLLGPTRFRVDQIPSSYK